LPTVADHLTKPRLLLQPDDDVLKGIEALVEKEITAALVVDDDHKLVGILTVTDCLRVVSAAAYRGEIHGGPVSAYMSPVRVVLRPEMDLFEAAREFLSCHVQTLPVLEKNGTLVGRMTRHALLSAIQNFAAGQEQARVELEKAGKADGGSRPTSIEEMQKRAARSSRENLVKFFSRSN
jgi:predicted transcriptional regulator